MLIDSTFDRDVPKCDKCKHRIAVVETRGYKLRCYRCASVKMRKFLRRTWKKGKVRGVLSSNHVNWMIRG